MKFLPFLLAFFAMAAPGRAADEYVARTFTNPEGQTLPYRLLIPKDYDAGRKYPLVVFLHGAGERGDDNAAQLKHGTALFLKTEVRRDFPCFVVAPQCPKEQRWADIDWSSDMPRQPEQVSGPMRLTLAALETLKKEFSIDAERLYVTGLSMGGYGTWDLITRFPERFAAAVPVCGGGDKEKPARAKAAPLWAFHGELDQAVKLVRTTEMIDAIRAAGGDPLLTIYPNTGHDSWTNAYQEPDLLPWLFAQKLGEPQVAFATVAGPHAMPPTSSFPGEGPTQPGTWFRPLWKARRTEAAAAKESDRGAVVFFGDSITQGWKSLAQDFPNIKVANRGISGDTSRGLRYRLQEDVLSLQPTAVNLLIGTNDLSLGASPEVVAENIRAIVEELQKANPAMPVIINKVMPRGPQPGKFPEKIRALNALLEQAYTGREHIVLADTWSLFADEQGSSKREDFPDMLHPNEAGYAKWRSSLQPILEKLQFSK